MRNYQDLALTAQQVLDAMRVHVEAAVQNTPTEQRLADIWASLLGITAIRSTDNFFDLGGHSLLMVQMVMQIRETFDVELTVDDVYSATLTLSDLARKIDSGNSGEYDDLMREIEAMSDEEVERLLSANSPHL